MPGKLAIVPAHNEVGAVGPTVAEIRRWAPDFDVLVVDDGSTDATAAAGARRPAPTVLALPFNLGIGGAMQAGYLYAREHGYEVAVQVDGDGQHDPRHIHDLLARLHGDPELNMVTGSRFLDADGDGYRSSAARRVGIRVFSRVVSLITRQRVTDPTSGFRMTDRRGIELFARDYPHDYPEVEAILLMHSHRLESCEIPVVMRPRTSGSSAISSTQSVYYMVKVLLAVFVGLFRASRRSSRRTAAADRTPRAHGGLPAGRRGARHVILLASQCTRATRPLQRIEIIAVSVLICVLIFELIRRRRLMERYAILWLLAGLTVFVLALGQGLLTKLTHAAGISYAPSAVFAIAFLFVLAMLVQFSMTISRLSDQNTALAQRLALLQQRLEEGEDDHVPASAEAAKPPVSSTTDRA